MTDAPEGQAVLDDTKHPENDAAQPMFAISSADTAGSPVDSEAEESSGEGTPTERQSQPYPTKSTVPTKVSQLKRKHSEVDTNIDEPTGGLFGWFSRASEEQVEADRKRMRREHEEVADKAQRCEEAVQQKAVQCKTDLATARKRRQRNREREVDKEEGRRDSEGNLIRKKVSLRSCGFITEYQLIFGSRI
jgi:hypothetical protein